MHLTGFFPSPFLIFLEFPNRHYRLLLITATGSRDVRLGYGLDPHCNLLVVVHCDTVYFFCIYCIDTTMVRLRGQCPRARLQIYALSVYLSIYLYIYNNCLEYSHLSVNFSVIFLQQRNDETITIGFCKKHKTIIILITFLIISLELYCIFF